MHESELVKKAGIKKLYSTGCWGKGHMLIDRFKSGLPAHLRGEATNAVKRAGKTRAGLRLWQNKIWVSSAS